MTIDRDDPRLTAFVLGELDPTEHAVVEANLIDSADCREAVEEIRLTTRWLSEQLQAEIRAHHVVEKCWDQQPSSCRRDRGEIGWAATAVVGASGHSEGVNRGGGAGARGAGGGAVSSRASAAAGRGRSDGARSRFRTSRPGSGQT